MGLCADEGAGNAELLRDGVGGARSREAGRDRVRGRETLGSEATGGGNGQKREHGAGKAGVQVSRATKKRKNTQTTLTQWMRSPQKGSRRLIPVERKGSEATEERRRAEESALSESTARKPWDLRFGFRFTQARRPPEWAGARR